MCKVWEIGASGCVNQYFLVWSSSQYDQMIFTNVTWYDDDQVGGNQYGPSLLLAQHKGEGPVTESPVSHWGCLSHKLDGRVGSSLLVCLWLSEAFWRSVVYPPASRAKPQLGRLPLCSMGTLEYQIYPPAIDITGMPWPTFHRLKQSSGISAKIFGFFTQPLSWT